EQKRYLEGSVSGVHARGGNGFLGTGNPPQAASEPTPKGAHFYVCGDAKRMAPDVDAALTQICADHGKMDAASAKAFVKDLRAQHRYQTDVY
ncbi:MAG: hypothetical protein ACREDV_00245, partial [Methylocella sp.]